MSVEFALVPCSVLTQHYILQHFETHFETLKVCFPWSIDVHVYRGSYMSAHVLLKLLNELGKRNKMRGLPSILSLFRNEFYKFNNTRARMLDSIYHITLRLL